MPKQPYATCAHCGRELQKDEVCHCRPGEPVIRLVKSPAQMAADAARKEYVNAFFRKRKEQGMNGTNENWIRVTDELPATSHRKKIDGCTYYDSDPVAVVAVDDIGDRAIGTGTFYIGNEDGKSVYGWDGVTIEDVGLYACEVTHWMPLPKLPEE